jgi:cobalt-zinc-cadmium efflux system outer membrane protein
MSLLLHLLGGLSLATSPAPIPLRDAPSCASITSPGAAARCAVRHAPAVDVARSEIAVANARRDIARVILPDHPTVDVLVAARRGADDRDVNVYATLRQAIEIAGQRRTRSRVADAALDVAAAEVARERRSVAAIAVATYYEALAARRRGDEMGKALEVARKLEGLAAERTKAGAAAGLEHELARAERVLAERRVLDARRDEAIASETLAVMVGVDARALRVSGDLAPIERVSTDASTRPEIAVASARARVHERRYAMIRRSRVPSPELVVSVQRDGFGEFVAGGGISLGIPLPSPLAPNKRGELSESRAEARRARAEQTQVEHRIAIETRRAGADVAARRETLALYDAEITEGARVALDALGDAMVAGQLDLRDALVAQRTLLEVLQGRLTAEYELCAAALVDAHAAGRDLEALP